MKREELILKWLDNELSKQELEAFKALEDYHDLIAIDHNIKSFKANEYDVSAEFANVLSAIKEDKKAQPKTHWLKSFMRIAAILVVCFSLYYYTTTLDTKTNTEIAQKTPILLPDDSSVSLNSKSFLTFNKSDWKNNREIKLEGEAFFKVTKGSSFKVITTSGTVTVYGTQFNVKQRKNHFEVICYEGLVGVSHLSRETKLKPGDRFLIIDGETIATEKENLTSPSWLNNESSFKSLPYKTVIEEFKRQYDVDLKLVNIDTNILFTGSFTHNNLEIALKSITLPLNLIYSKTNSTITLQSE